MCMYLCNCTKISYLYKKICVCAYVSVQKYHIYIQKICVCVLMNVYIYIIHTNIHNFIYKCTCICILIICTHI